MTGARRILIVDDHPLLRDGLRQLIEREPDLRVCGEAGDAVQALKLVDELHPDVVTIDISLPGRTGTTLLKDLQARHPRLPTLVISMHDESLYAERALRGGARGYMNKQEARTHVVPAIRKVLAGEVWVSEGFAAGLAGRLARGGDLERSPIEQLSDRELEVFELVGRGRGPREIGEALFVSVKTVQAHKANIRQKLDLPTARELALRAARWVEEQR